eukprot:Protomagalhaensia_wolfi_Nauph_80__2327@NODE_2525_length_1067_cov_802_155642_g1978_i0_p1_GENE_NODE_2525_length_1067_cov_802_155642_g1978_i0NODE_2525_length_1067_cov_802_155642_g1978_i0_p1_ORF_typecomplete_len202_score50_29DJ1_PfpI/PF01965_24/2_1e31ThiJ_like/PF17124_5/0_99ThiJ_like/PF17124_5/0_075Catalase_C/PF18011_1/0_061B12binding/PF02310_19/0_052_NODE_2525_length_1067_cov_802_155642_g1978_i0303908
MPTAAIFFADGFEEIEAVTPCDVLARAGFEVTVVGVTGSEVKGAHKGVKLHADITIDQAKTKVYDVLVVSSYCVTTEPLQLPGGMPGSKHLAESADVVEMAKKQKAEGRWVAAICASPAMTLHQKGVMDASQKGVCYTAMGKDMGGNYLSDEKITTHVDNKIITSRGPGTAMEFALTIVKLVAGESKAKEVAGALLYPHSF